MPPNRAGPDSSASPRAEAKGLALVVEVEGDLPAVSADPDRLAHVLGNLLDNAVRHTGPGGRVTLAARPAHLAELRAAAQGIDDEGMQESNPNLHMRRVAEEMWSILEMIG